MKSILSLLLLSVLIVVASSFPIDEALLSKPVNQRDLVKQINSDPSSTWNATIYPQFEGKFIRDIRGLFGARLSSPIVDNKEVNGIVDENIVKAVPSSFDSRTQWPTCIHPIRNQQQCGSCWAFSASAALADRFCIASNGKVNTVLSPEYMLECDTSNLGCEGGYLSYTWSFLTTVGTVPDTCAPYISGNGKVLGKCPGKTSTSKCPSGNANLSLYKVKKGTAKGIRGAAAIQNEIIANGPVQSGFTVYEDFMSYKSGVYTHKTGKQLGGHAIKIIGWGVLNGVDYWIIANSWGTDWGINGYFYMKRGTNECGVEQDVWSGIPEL
ncbi:hypothetical protein ABK040_000123 [Willaertia magna]